MANNKEIKEKYALPPSHCHKLEHNQCACTRPVSSINELTGY